MHHLLNTIEQKRAEIAYAKTALLAALNHGTRAEQLHSLNSLEALRIELRAYERLLNLINTSEAGE